MKKLIPLLLFFIICSTTQVPSDPYGYHSSQDGVTTLLISLIALAAFIFSVLLLIRVWNMTKDVKDIKEILKEMCYKPKKIEYGNEKS